MILQIFTQLDGNFYGAFTVMRSTIEVCIPTLQGG